jgi:hypothetical protein
VALSAVASDGTVIFDGALAPTGPVVIEESGAAPSRAVFDTRPGRLRLQMSIEDAASQVLDSDIRDVVVPDLRRDLAFGTPEVLRARNAREFRLLEGADAVPVAAREFSRAERLLIRFPVYAPAGASPAISARLLTRMGQPMRDLPVAPPSATTALNTIDLPLASLAAGEYIVELSASTSAADAKERVTFRVTF